MRELAIADLRDALRVYVEAPSLDDVERPGWGALLGLQEASRAKGTSVAFNTDRGCSYLPGRRPSISKRLGRR